LYQEEETRLKNELINKKICITINKTTDSCGRAVVNILFSFFNKTKLVKTNFLQSINHTTIS